MCVQRVADHADGFPHEALMIRPLLHVHIVCLQVRGRVLARLFTVRWVGGGGGRGQAIERQTKRARGKRNGCCPLFLLSYAYAEHEEGGPRHVKALSKTCSRKSRAVADAPTRLELALITYVELRLRLTLLISPAPSRHPEVDCTATPHVRSALRTPHRRRSIFAPSHHTSAQVACACRTRV
jgi:hypothetical protein